VKDSLPDKIAHSIIADIIKSENVKVGDKLPSMRKLQEIYGVSSVTIVQATNELYNWGYLEKRKGSGCYLLDYKSNGNGNDNQTNNMIGFVSSTTKNSDIIMSMYNGIKKVCDRNGYKILMSSSDTSYEIEQQNIKEFIDMGCKGIVLCPTSRTHEELEHDYLKDKFLDFPIVLIDIAYESQKRPMVVFDNYGAAYDITTHMINEGRKKIAFMKKEFLHKSSDDRYLGYLDALKDNGIEFNDEFIGHISKTFNNKELVTIINKWVGSSNRPDAIVAGEDLDAMEIIRMLMSLGVKVHEDIMVAGFDDNPMARMFEPAFITSNHDFEYAAEKACKMLIDIIDKKVDKPFSYVVSLTKKLR